MTKNPETLNESEEKHAGEQHLLRQDAIEALRRLREIGEKLPSIDAALVIREGRNMAERDFQR